MGQSEHWFQFTLELDPARARRGDCCSMGNSTRRFGLHCLLPSGDDDDDGDDGDDGDGDDDGDDGDGDDTFMRRRMVILKDQ